MRSGIERCFMELFACIKMEKRADKMLHSVGLQLPLENTFVGSDNSIAHSVANVKTYRENLDNFAKIEYNNTSDRKKLSRQRELSNDLTKLDSRGRSSSDEVAVYSSEYAMELNGRLHISLDSNRLTS